MQYSNLFMYNFLSLFLQEDILSNIKELPKVLKLHKIMMKHFSFRIDKQSAKEQTLEDAIKETNEGIQYIFF